MKLFENINVSAWKWSTNICLGKCRDEFWLGKGFRKVFQVECLIFDLYNQEDLKVKIKPEEKATKVENSWHNFASLDRTLKWLQTNPKSTCLQSTHLTCFHFPHFLHFTWIYYLMELFTFVSNCFKDEKYFTATPTRVLF